MNKLLLPLAASVCLVSSCEKATPESYFSQAVLNCNLMHGFAGNGMERQLNEPSVKLADSGGNKMVTMTRKETVDNLIRSVEEAYGKIKKLQETDDTREMLQASRAVFDYVLPVYHNEYQQLASLHDEGMGKTRIEELQKSIQAKYQAGFQSRIEALTTIAKPYADRHGIKVQWDVRTSPTS